MNSCLAIHQNHQAVACIQSAPLGNRCMASRLGFTLVELLVVVSLLGVLMAILLPGLKSAREDARSALCACQLREVGRALEIYAQTHEDRYPTAEAPRNKAGAANWWENPAFLGILKLTPKPQGRSLLTCPSDRDPGRCLDQSPKDCWASYGANASAFGMQRGGSKRGRQKSQMQFPAQALAFCDVLGARSAPHVVGWQRCIDKNFAFRHRERCTIVYVDTHMGWIREDDVPDDTDAWEDPFWGNVPCLDEAQ